MTGEVPPPSAGDVLLAARAYNWPPLEGVGVALAAGEASWRAYLSEATAAEVWAVLRAADLNEADADAEIDREEDDDEDGAG